MAIMLEKNIDELFSSVVFFYDKNNKPRASGFLLKYPLEELESRYVVYLITAKHNILESIKDQGFISVCMTTSPKINGISKLEDWHLDDNTDLAVSIYNPRPFLTHDGRNISRKRVFSKNMLAKKDDENIVECAYTLSIGLFSNYYGKTREQPILRFGNIAMIPKDKISIKLPTENGGVETKDVEAYLIEQKSVGGMSGSIVLGTSNDLAGRAKIIGIIYGHYDDLNDKNQNDYENQTEEQQCQNIKKDCDNIYSQCQKIEQQMQKTYKRMKSINSGISIVIPSYKILELLEREDVRKEREDAKKRYLDSLRNLS